MTARSQNQHALAPAARWAGCLALPCDPILAQRAPRWAGARLTHKRLPGSGFMAAPAAR
jgi:hypothetical protein